MAEVRLNIDCGKVLCEKCAFLFARRQVAEFSCSTSPNVSIQISRDHVTADSMVAFWKNWKLLAIVAGCAAAVCITLIVAAAAFGCVFKAVRQVGGSFETELVCGE